MFHEHNNLNTQLSQDLTKVIRLFTIRLTNSAKGLLAPQLVLDDGKRIAQIYANTSIPDFNQKIIARFISRLFEKVKVLESNTSPDRIEDIKQIKECIVKASNMNSISSVILKILGIQNISLAGEKLEKRTNNNDVIEKWEQQNKKQKQVDKKDKLSEEKMLRLYRDLNLNEVDFKRKFIRVQEDLERNSRYVYEEMMERNAHTFMQIKKYQTDYKKIGGSKQLFKKARSKRIQTQVKQDYMEKLNNFVTKNLQVKSTSSKQKNLFNKFKRNQTNTGIIQSKNQGLISQHNIKQKAKSSSASYLLPDSEKINRIGSGTILQMSKVHFIQASEVETIGKPMKSLIGIDDSERRMVRFKQQLVIKKNRIDSILNKMKTSQLQRRSTAINLLPPMQPNYVMVCKGFQK